MGFVVFQNNVTVFMNGKIRTIFTITGKPYENIWFSFHIETKHILDS